MLAGKDGDHVNGTIIHMISHFVGRPILWAGTTELLTKTVAPEHRITGFRTTPSAFVMQKVRDGDGVKAWVFPAFSRTSETNNRDPSYDFDDELLVGLISITKIGLVQKVSPR